VDPLEVNEGEKTGPSVRIASGAGAVDGETGREVEDRAAIAGLVVFAGAAASARGVGAVVGAVVGRGVVGSGAVSDVVSAEREASVRPTDPREASDGVGAGAPVRAAGVRVATGNESQIRRAMALWDIRALISDRMVQSVTT
jgi:hypothetical protein